MTRESGGRISGLSCKAGISGRVFCKSFAGCEFQPGARGVAGAGGLEGLSPAAKLGIAAAVVGVGIAVAVSIDDDDTVNAHQTHAQPD